MGEHHALRRAGRPRGEDQLDRSRPARGAARPRAALPSRAGTGRRRVGARARRRSWSGTVPAGRRAGRARPGRCPRTSCFAPERRDDVLDRVGRHAQIERNEDEPRPHRPEVDGRELRRRRATRSGADRPAPGPSARRRHAASRLRRSSSRKLQCRSCRRRCAALARPDRRSASTASSRRSTRERRRSVVHRHGESGTRSPSSGDARTGCVPFDPALDLGYAPPPLGGLDRPGGVTGRLAAARARPWARRSQA